MTYREALSILNNGIWKAAEGIPDGCKALTRANDAIKQQLPKAPIRFYHPTNSFNCPKCYQRLGCESDGKLCTGRKPRFCPDCGQALDWSDDNGKA